MRAVRLENISAGKELNWFSCKCNVVRAVRSSNISAGKELNWFSRKPKLVRAVRSSNIPAGKELNWFLLKSNDDSTVRPSKSPDFSVVIDLPISDKDVIAARCSKVTSAALFTPGTAVTIAARTCGVRSLTGVISA